MEVQIEAEALGTPTEKAAERGRGFQVGLPRFRRLRRLLGTGFG